MNDNRQSGCYRNLEKQLNSIMKNCNEGSIKTRYRYLEASKRFCEFLSVEYKLQKFENVKSKHLISYVEALKEQGLAPASIKTDIAGIRFFHRRSGSNNILIDNSKLNLQPREYGKINRAWLPSELSSAVTYAKSVGRMDVAFATRFAYYFSTRLEEVCNLRVNDLKRCMVEKELKIKGKGGKVRYVPMTTPEQRALVQDALACAKENRLSHTDRLIVDNRKGGVQAEKKSLQNFISNHQDKFIQSDRQHYLAGKKIRADKLTFHGLRAAYAQNYYNEIKIQNKELPDREAKLKVSVALGHNREEVTKIYLD